MNIFENIKYPYYHPGLYNKKASRRTRDFAEDFRFRYYLCDFRSDTGTTYFVRARVSLAMASSSFVGMTQTLTFESGVEMVISLP